MYFGLDGWHRTHSPRAYELMMNGDPVSWKPRRQDSPALSTSGAEYMVASLCRQEIVCVRAILRDFGVSQSEDMLKYEDNLA
jgi:hypothetical protein